MDHQSLRSSSSSRGRSASGATGFRGRQRLGRSGPTSASKASLTSLARPASALVAILRREPERRAFIEAIEAADARLMSVATFVEISIVIEARHGVEGVRDLDHFVGRAGVELVPVDPEHGKVACSALSRFGKGRHRAGLNYGDCFSYALAISTGEPLLCKGDDFVYTDVTIVGLGSL